MFKNENVGILTNVYSGNCLILGTGETRRVENVYASGTGHSPGYDNSKVLALTITDYNLHFAPTNIEDKMPKLQSLSLNRMNIESIELSDFSVFPELRQLDLSSNSLTTINRKIFDDNGALEAIDLSRNPIKHIAHYVFDNLPRLRILRLESTACVNTTTSETELEALRFSVFLQCPPTSTMIGDEIMNSEVFQGMVEHFESEIERLEKEIEDL